MAARPSFSGEISNMLHASHGNPIEACMQCGTCSGTCPVATFMDPTPRRLIGLIRADFKGGGLGAGARGAPCHSSRLESSAWRDSVGWSTALFQSEGHHEEVCPVPRVF